MTVRFAVLLLAACSSQAKPPAAQPAPIANGTHSCSDAALGLENASRGVRAPDHRVFDTLRARCLEDAWPAAAVDCFATMAEGDLGRCSRNMPDAMREAIFAALSGKEPGANIYVTRARLQQLQVGVPECDRFVAAVTNVLTCERLAIDQRLTLGNETADFWALPTTGLPADAERRMAEVCGKSLATLQQQAVTAGCMP